MGNTKKLAIISSGNSDKFGAIIEYFKLHSDIEIICLSDNTDSDIFKLKAPEFVKTYRLKQNETEKFFKNNKFDLIVINNYKSQFNRNIYKLGKFINVHPSLLPAFEGNNAVYRAFAAGVRVSGVTIHTLTDNPQNDKIIAQYPVLISNLMHFNEFEEAIFNLECN